MREKLIELMTDNLPRVGDLPKCDNPLQYTMDEIVGRIADHLIANGVTIQKWIPVTERLPEKDGQYLCIYHFGEYPRMTFTRVLDYYATDIVPHFQHTLGDGSMKVDYWMPLPEAPKGE